MKKYDILIITFILIITTAFILACLKYIKKPEYETKVLYERKPIEYIDGIKTYYYVPYDTILIKKQKK